MSLERSVKNTAQYGRIFSRGGLVIGDLEKDQKGLG